MQSFKIIIFGEFQSGKTAFVRSVDEIEEGPLPRDVSRVADWGHIRISDQIMLYFFAWPRGFDAQELIRILAPAALEGLSHLMQMFEKFSLSDLSDRAVILIIDSVDPEQDWRNKSSLQNIQYLIGYKKFPYLIALSKQDLPNARTPQQIRDILAIPDDIKVLGYDVKDPSSTKRIVLALMELMPQDEIMQQVIDTLKVKI